MRQSVELVVKASTEEAFAALRDLETYRDWLGFIHSVDELVAANETSWNVVLRSELGPFARMKKLRMVRTSELPYSSVTFSRVEIDGKEHSNWTLDVSCLSLTETTTQLSLTVVYSGGFWSRPLESVFNSHVEDAKVKLREYFDSRV